MTIRGPLTDDARKITGDALQGALVDLIDLSLVAKQLHWNVVGRSFRSVHLQLDEVVDVARKYADEVAERAAAISVNADGRAETVAKSSNVPHVEDVGWVDDQKVIKMMVDAHRAVIAGMRDRIDALDKPDPVSQDLLIQASAELEKSYWMWQAEQPGTGAKPAT
nr:DNA starvation/stationary phase protection protein [Fodinicola acaciae]